MRWLSQHYEAVRKHRDLIIGSCGLLLVGVILVVLGYADISDWRDPDMALPDPPMASSERVSPVAADRHWVTGVESRSDGSRTGP